MPRRRSFAAGPAIAPSSPVCSPKENFLCEGDVWRQERVGSVFEGSTACRRQVIPHHAPAFVTAEATLIDPADPSARPCHERGEARRRDRRRSDAPPVLLPARTLASDDLSVARSAAAALHANCGFVCPSHVLLLALPARSAPPSNRCSRLTHPSRSDLVFDWALGWLPVCASLQHGGHDNV